MQTASFTDLIDAIDDLTSAVEALSENSGARPVETPVCSILVRIDALMQQPSIATSTLAALADHRDELARLWRRFSSRLLPILRARASIPDPGADVRPTVADALSSDTTADALGALLRVSEWVAKVEAKHPVAGEDI